MKPLNDTMDGVLAWRLGRVSEHAANGSDHRDLVERGRQLLRDLNEADFELCIRAPRAKRTAIPPADIGPGAPTLSGYTHGG